MKLRAMHMSETAQFFMGASFGVAVIFLALVASTASIRAGEKWESDQRVRATALASFAGLSGAAALAAIAYGLVLVALALRGG